MKLIKVFSNIQGPMLWPLISEIFIFSSKTNDRIQFLQFSVVLKQKRQFFGKNVLKNHNIGSMWNFVCPWPFLIKMPTLIMSVACLSCLKNASDVPPESKFIALVFFVKNAILNHWKAGTKKSSQCLAAKLAWSRLSIQCMYICIGIASLQCSVVGK
jgi:hypothetical protein